MHESSLAGLGGQLVVRCHGILLKTKIKNNI